MQLNKILTFPTAEERVKAIRWMIDELKKGKQLINTKPATKDYTTFDEPRLAKTDKTKIFNEIAEKAKDTESIRGRLETSTLIRDLQRLDMFSKKIGMDFFGFANSVKDKTLGLIAHQSDEFCTDAINATVKAMKEKHLTKSEAFNYLLNQFKNK